MHIGKTDLQEDFVNITRISKPANLIKSFEFSAIL